MPENTNIIVTQLPAYVEQNRDELVRKVVLGGRTLQYMVPQVGIKTKAAINYLDVDPKFQDGRGCKFTPQEGGIELTQREIETGIIKVEFEVCPDTLLGKYAEYLVKIHASEEDFPFEEYIMADTIAKINLKLEKAIWQGDKSSDNADLNKFDGLLKLAANEDDTINITYAESDSAWDKIKALILALPEEVLESDGRAVIFVGTDLFRNFMLEVVEKNFYHYSGPQDEDVKEFIFPGTNVIVASTVGLSRTGKLYGSHDRNLYYGCDLLDAKEEVVVKWDDMNGVFKVKVKWNSGVQTAFPDLVVVSSLAPYPTPVTISGATAVSLGSDAGSEAETYAASDGGAIKAAVPAAAASWLEASVNGNIVTFTAAANVGAAPRSAVVRISTASEGSAGYLDVTISQAAPAAAPTISGAASLSLANTAGSNDRTYATSDGSDVLAEVTTEGADWLSVEVGENGHTVTFTRTAQEAAAAERTATVHLSTATGGSKDVTVTQAAG